MPSAQVARLVVGALVVMAAARFVPAGAAQYVIGVAAVLALCRWLRRRGSIRSPEHVEDTSASGERRSFLGRRSFGVPLTISGTVSAEPPEVVADAGFAGVGLRTPLDEDDPIEVVMPPR